jgi:chromosome segregation ATPase
MADERDVLIKIQIENAAQLEQASQNLKDLNRQYKEGKISGSEFAKAQAELKQQTEAIKQQFKQQQLEVLASQNTLEGLRAKYKLLTAEATKLDVGSKEFAATQREAGALSARLKELEGGLGQNQRNVGNYKEALGQGKAALGNFAQGVTGVNMAMAASPIGMIIAALGILTKAVSTSDSVMVFFKGTLRAINDLFALLGRSVLDLGKLLTGQMSFSQFTTSLKENASALKQAASAAIDYEKALDDLEAQQKENLVTEAKLSAEIRVLERQFRDTTKSIAEREKISQQIQQRDEERLKVRLSAIDQEIQANQKYLASLAKNSNEREEISFKLLELEAKRIDMQGESLALQEKQEARLNKLAEERQARAEKARLAQEAELERLRGQEDKFNKMLAEDRKKQEAALLKAQEASNRKKEELEKEATRVKEEEAKKRAEAERRVFEQQKQIETARVSLLQNGVAIARQLAGDNKDALKAISYVEAVVNTANGVTRALASAPPPFNFALAASVGALGALQIGTIAAAAGGGEFLTTKPTMLLVGDNPGGIEKVTVEPISGKGQTRITPQSGLIAMAGGGSLTAIGGSTAISQLSAPVKNEIDQTRIFAKMLAKTQLTVGVTDINKAQKRVSVSESRAKLKRA